MPEADRLAALARDLIATRILPGISREAEERDVETFRNNGDAEALKLVIAHAADHHVGAVGITVQSLRAAGQSGVFELVTHARLSAVRTVIDACVELMRRQDRWDGGLIDRMNAIVALSAVNPEDAPLIIPLVAERGIEDAEAVAGIVTAMRESGNGVLNVGVL